jgi:AraC-like DNA-binding protein
VSEWADGAQHDFLGAEGLAELEGFIAPLGEPGEFGLRMRSVRARDVLVTYAAVAPSRTTAKAIFSGEDACVHLVFPFDAQLFVEDFAERGIPAGGMIAYAESSPLRLRMESTGRVIVVSLTRGVPPGRLVFSVESPYLLSGPSASMSAVRAVAEVVFRSGEDDAAAADLLVSLSAAVLVEASIEAWSEDRDEALVAEATRIIAQDYRNKDLSPAEVAKSLGISIRALQRAFAGRGGMTHTIRAYRTQEALRLLSSGSIRDASLERVARSSGFLDGRAMRKAIIASTGIEPRDYRKNFG